MAIRSTDRLIRLTGYLMVLAVIAFTGVALAATGLTRFSEMPVGELSADGAWKHEIVKNTRPNTASIVSGTGVNSYLLIRSSISASAWSHAVPAPLASGRNLSWQWLVRGAPGRSELNDKSADDFAARVYVVFDYPLDKVPLGQRMAIRLARAIYGDIPAAALCYVWLPGGKTELLVDSPYTSRVKVLVTNGESSDGRWRRQQRDVLDDFQRAFGDEYGPGMPRLQAIVVSADSDQTGGRIEVAFADIKLGR
ncbi:MAG: DUF3047 domain-containing protein [Gammaproteobacteria bacterium]|nr:DUF3047 domain-containing protein [Gammaproteobacteria bacterium]